ncbi:carbohydrate esterase family 4 protein [Cystobasidium minutum MCA 4210]|uniref:carbohydrate esterase family 4 protein n=1 Tax=Cystobasidium minutum MCA 4210 TaxID=1397322 RepID=UPI0034CD3EF0|eukprot:jgi/Rhomi1/173918/fgenesh1_kg.6_\
MGPSEVTEKLLDKLKDLKVPATFFLNGNFEDRCIYRYASVLHKAVKNGITLGHHTWNHTKLENISWDKLRRELRDLDKAFLDILGFRPRLFSPPAGFTDQDKYLAYIMATDANIVKFSFDTKEKDKDSTDYALDHFRDFVKSGADSGISLSRDLRAKNVDEVIEKAAKILTSGEGGERKYQLVDAETCLGFKPFYPPSWDPTKKSNLPDSKKEWNDKNKPCADFLGA